MIRLTAAAVLPITVALVLAIGCTGGNKSVLLRYKYFPDKTTSYQSTFKGNTRIVIGDSLVVDRSNEIITNIVSRVEVMINDSTAEILESRSYRYHIVNHLDSTESDTAMKGDDILVRVTTRGKLLDLRLPNSDFHQISQISGQIDNEYKQGLPVFPEYEITPGREWTQETTILDGSEVRVAATTYRIESFVRERGYDCVTISYKGRTVIPYQSEPSDSLYRSGESILTVSGLMYFAYSDGFVVSQRERRIIDGRGWQNKGSKPSDVGQDVTVSIEYDIELTLTGPPE